MGDIKKLNNLPDIVNYTFTSKILSTNEEVKGRPMRVKDEKAILTARESNNIKIFFNAIKNVLLYIYPDINFDILTPYDLKFLFLDHNRKNIKNTLEINDFKCEKCNFIISNQVIDLNNDLIIENKVVESETVIEVLDDLKIKFVFPKMNSLIKYIKNDDDLFNFEIISDCILEIIDERNEEKKVYKKNEFTHKEITKWVEKLPLTSFQKILKWIEENNIDIYIEKEFICPNCENKIKKRFDDFYFF